MNKGYISVLVSFFFLCASIFIFLFTYVNLFGSPIKPGTSVMAGSPKTTKLIYESYLASFMPADFNGNDWGMGWTINPVTNITNQVFKFDRRMAAWTDPYDPSNPVVLPGSISTDSARLRAKANPTNYWILGEEENFWYPQCNGAGKPAKMCQRCKSGCSSTFTISPEVYAHWFHDYANAIKQGWAESGSSVSGKIIGFYFVNDDLPNQTPLMTSSPTSTYLDRFKKEWDRLWPNTPVPIDGVDYNDRPNATNHQDLVGQIAVSRTYWTKKHQEMLNRSWLKDKFMWVETDRGNKKANVCQVGQRLSRLVKWADQTPWVDAVLWYSTYVPKKDPLWVAALYDPNQSGPVQGKLTPVGQTFRDRGVIAKDCGGPGMGVPAEPAGAENGETVTPDETDLPVSSYILP